MMWRYTVNMLKLKSYRFQFFDKEPIYKAGTQEPQFKDCDGVVDYVMYVEMEDKKYEDYEFHIFQPFAKGRQFFDKDSRENVWNWDGNREKPSITPSFLLYGSNDGKGRLHLFVRAGKLDILGDTSVDCSGYVMNQ